jgi:hypothetical protein
MPGKNNQIMLRVVNARDIEFLLQLFFVVVAAAIAIAIAVVAKHAPYFTVVFCETLQTHW